MGLARLTLVALLAFGLVPQVAVAAPHCPVQIQEVPDKPPVFALNSGLSVLHPPHDDWRWGCGEDGSFQATSNQAGLTFVVKTIVPLPWRSPEEVLRERMTALSASQAKGNVLDKSLIRRNDVPILRYQERETASAPAANVPYTYTVLRDLDGQALAEMTTILHRWDSDNFAVRDRFILLSSDIFARARISPPVTTTLQPPSSPRGWHALTIQGKVGLLKALLALLAAVVWICGAWWEKRKQRRYRFITVLLGLLSVCALFNWLNWFQFHGPGYHHRAIHVHEFYHYYIGSKYFRELRYDQLYLCTVAADLERGHDRFIKRGWVRNLKTYRSERVATVETDAARCRQRFSEQRWAEFQKDLDWFRDQLWLDPRVRPDTTENFIVDHGYNASPVWGILGTSLTNSSRASDTQITLLALIDPLLLFLLFLSIRWAFGWRVLFACALWWATSLFSVFGFVGGALLRQDWLAATVIGICMLRKGRPLTAGFLLGWATLLRVFPGIIFIGLAIHATLDLWQRRSWRLTSGHKRVLAGAALAAAILLPLSVAIGGVSCWREFTENITAHVRIAVDSKNVLGLRSATASLLGRPTLSVGYSLLLFAAAVAVSLLALRRIRLRPDWVVTVLMVTLLPFWINAASYYYVVFLVLAMLGSRVRGVTPLLLLASALTSLMPLFSGRIERPSYVAAIFILAVLATITVILSQLKGQRVQPQQASLAAIAAGSAAERGRDREAT